ncbi:CapA family protein [Streptomyces sp. ISL-10]|uniref:CapA family protein n=1 Tax=Streptomyces sp. ISL-10 TaxID=2819172 RepID=UPI001BE58123|nr:CapA family protein [Streptomyces sp. ISL-10]MBT2365537.1 CapA family protein [Streptomyces sp. ISL-10]
MGGDLVTLFLSGDVMLGRGVDQILPHPGDPALSEPYIKDARAYVKLAEAVNGTIPRPVPFSWPWGDALPVLDAAAPDVRLLNVETSITVSDDEASGKEVLYRMHPANLPCLTAARPDVCVLANNHVLDYGRRGLEETLAALADAGLRTAGAGRDLDVARRCASVPLPRGRRVLVVSLGMESSGVPSDWAATARRSGVHFAAEPSPAVAAEVTARLCEAKRPGDVTVVSLHMGSNWGYRLPRDQVRFARALVDGGADIVHGHSSHHPRPVEVYRGKLVLYGCGDLINDYEGIGGYERYRDDLRLLPIASVDPATGALHELRVTPLQARRMRLGHASAADCHTVHEVLSRISHGLGVRMHAEPDGSVTVRPS